MILDTLENIGKYANLNPLFPKVVEYLQNTDLLAQEPGRVNIDGNKLFVNHNLAHGKTVDDAMLETHDAMIDIQIPLSCPEVMGYIPRQLLPDAEYDAKKDITFYPVRPEQYITVHPGEFVIFFPQDGHAPCISPVPEYRKVIFKVKA
ncbi:MAG: YhcH/YjgK/YiaL family protein [Bacteroidaceae bacterium]|nr:YhcH/YjgK/YiaL family protein [Bacteroidaceae bacterium]MBR1520833.1 YhcH/YjgK/YiaL family protein [Bacteroidaceae bacterium]